MSRRHPVVLLLMFAALLTPVGCKDAPDAEPAAGPATTPAAQAAPVVEGDLIELVIVATNDVHGYILPRKVSMAIDEEGKVRYPVDIGGVEWFSGYLDILRRQHPDGVLLLDGGDMFQGTMISNESEGATVVAAMNYLGYAAAAVGNHEFDFGPVGEGDEGDPFGALKAIGPIAEFPLLAANLIDRASGQPIDWEGFAPTTMVEVAGIKIGIVGGPTDTTPTYSKKRVGEGLEFRPLVEIVKEYAPKLRAQGAQVVIGLLHAGGVCEEFDDPDDLSSCDPNEELFQIAQAMEPGTVDLLVGGHTHHIVRHNVNGIPLMESGGTGKLFGMATLSFSKSAGKVVKAEVTKPVGICHYRFKGTDSCIYLDELPGAEKLPATFRGEKVAPREFLDSLLTPGQREMLAQAQEQLGSTALRDLVREDEADDPPMGLLITQILLDSFPEADLALFNGSGIRSYLYSGPITQEAVFQVLPFDSTPAFLHLKGRDLRDLLRLTTSGAHGMPVLRGLKLHVDNLRDECIQEDWNRDGTKEKWERNLLVSATLEDGSPLVDEKVYTVVTTSYLAGGGSDLSRILDKLPPETVSRPAQTTTTRAMLSEWLRTRRVELGGPNDPYTKHPDGPLIRIDNRDHQPGTKCDK